MYKTIHGYKIAEPHEREEVLKKLKRVEDFFCCQCTKCWNCHCMENKMVKVPTFHKFENGHPSYSIEKIHYCVECAAPLFTPDGRSYGGKHGSLCEVKEGGDLFRAVCPETWVDEVKAVADRTGYILDEPLRKLAEKKRIR